MGNFANTEYRQRFSMGMLVEVRVTELPIRVVPSVDGTVSKKLETEQQKPAKITVRAVVNSVVRIMVITERF